MITSTFPRERNNTSREGKIKSEAKGEDKMGEANLRNLASMSSGPGPLLEDSLLKALDTSAELTGKNRKNCCVVKGCKSIQRRKP